MIAASTPKISAAVMVTSAADLGSFADFYEGILLAHRPVFRHVAPRLPHEPHGVLSTGCALQAFTNRELGADMNPSM